MDRSDRQSYDRTNISPMVKWRNCKVLGSTSLEARGFASMANVGWSDGSIGSIGQAISMNNGNDLNLHSMTGLASLLPVLYVAFYSRRMQFKQFR